MGSVILKLELLLGKSKTLKMEWRQVAQSNETGDSKPLNSDKPHLPLEETFPPLTNVSPSLDEELYKDLD